MSAFLRAQPVSTSDVHLPAANTAAVVTYAAGTSTRHCLSHVSWSYLGVPTGGNIKIEDGAGNVVFSQAITAAGAGFSGPWIPGKMGTANRALIITLAAGGAGVTGQLSCNHWID